MPHARSQIRDAVVTAVTGLTTTSTRVYKSRVIPMAESNLPGLCVYARSDSPDYGNGAYGTKPVRVLDMRIEGYVRGSDDTTLDVIASEVETAIYANAGVAALNHGIYLGEQTLTMDGEGNDIIGVIGMSFLIHYRTAEGAPGTIV